MPFKVFDYYDYAVNYYGYLRNIDDLDIWLAPTNENRDAFIEWENI